MRKSRSKKRVKRYTIYLLIVILVTLAYDLCFGYTFKGLLEQRLDRLFSGDITFNINRVEGGVFRDIISTDIAIFHPDCKSPFTLERVEVPYRIWYPLLRKYRKFFDAETESIKIFFGEKNLFIKGFLSLKNDGSKLAIFGYFSFLNAPRNHVLRGDVTIEGKSRYSIKLTLDKDTEISGFVDFKAGSLSLKVKRAKGIVDVEILFPEEGTMILSAKINHITLKGVDVISNIHAIIKEGSNKTAFSVSIKDLILNYMPFDKLINIEGNYFHDKDLFVLDSLRLCGTEDNSDYVLKGSVRGNLKKERCIEADFDVKELHIEDFSFLREGQWSERGTLSGTLKLKGPTGKIDSDIHLSIQDGRFGDFEFRSLIATLKGQGGLLTIEDGRIIKKDGNFILSGEVDLGLLSSGKSLDTIDVKTDQKIAVWDGWEISKWLDTSKIRVKKKLGNEDVTVSFEIYANQDLFDSRLSDRENGVDIDFKFDKNESLKMRLREKESFLGVEHNTRF